MKLDENHEPVDEPVSIADESEIEVPKLSIVELMVLTAAMAIAFSFQEYLASMRNVGFGKKVLWLDLLQRANFSLILGLPIAAMYRFVIQKKMSGHYLLQPGHWVLFCVLILVLGYFVPVSILGLVFNDIENGIFQNYFIIYAISSLLGAIVMMFGALRFQRVWKWTLLLMAVKFLTTTFQMSLYAWFFDFGMLGVGSTQVLNSFEWIELAINSVTFIGLLVVLWFEVRNPKAKDLWHWLGIFMIFQLCALSPAMQYLTVLFYQP